jgi:mono/diheme cytochrome c family protein
MRSIAFSLLLAAASATAAELPLHLRDTGLVESDPAIVTFNPQYPLWSDGAEKRRWLRLPPGTLIDASQPDAWQFPVGTKLWKEFAVAGRAVETRFVERQGDGSWRFATYVWTDDGRDAVLAPERGTVVALPPSAGGRYTVPGRGDCLACHGGARMPVLGFGALQLSPDRDPLAPHARPRRAGDVDLRSLVARGLLRGLPDVMLVRPPRIAADSPVERAALGYLHGNCAQCHHAGEGGVPVRLTLEQSVADAAKSHAAALRSMLDAPSRYRPPGAADDARIVVRGDVAASVLATRMQSRHASVQMPPLGTERPDDEGLALVDHWITHDLPTRKENRP